LCCGFEAGTWRTDIALCFDRNSTLGLLRWNKAVRPEAWNFARPSKLPLKRRNESRDTTRTRIRAWTVIEAIKQTIHDPRSGLGEDRPKLGPAGPQTSLLSHGENEHDHTVWNPSNKWVYSLFKYTHIKITTIKTT